MADLPSESEQPGAVSNEDLQPWMRTKFAKWFGMVKLGHDGVMLDRMQRQLKAAEIQADISLKGTTEGVDTLYPSNGSEDDMAVNIGNEIHNHYEVGGPKDVALPSNSDPTPTTKPSKLSSLMPYVLAGGLAASGLGGWGLALYNHLHKSPPTVDTDHETDVTFPQ